MSQKKQKLELTWVGKDQYPRLEPRILIQEPDLSHHASTRRDGDLFENLLIHGDNLLALKALQQRYTGKIKCVFIDPPYNTGSAFAQYDDGLEHSVWLSLLRDRLEILQSLLSSSGSIWITIGDYEAHYLKVLCDEVFGRANFISSVIWNKKASPQANAFGISDNHDHILIYAKDRALWKPNLLARSAEAVSRYTNPDDDPRGPWTSGDCTISLTSGQRGAQFARTGFSPNIYDITTPSGRVVSPPGGSCWRFSSERMKELVADNRIYFGADGSNVPRYKRFLSEVQDGVVPTSVWLRDQVGDNQKAKREVAAFNREDVFATPKPEALLARIINIASDPGDIVLDSFAGSGTTGAVAHKMGRRWIMIELGAHCETHCRPRLCKVIDGTDAGGVTDESDWKGGGGFRYYRLAPSLLEKDKYGNWIISKEYDPSMLAEAVCGNLGFTYAPSQDEQEYWRHGHSSESDFIFVTTASMTHAALKKLSEDVGPDRTLLVCCKAFKADPDAFENLTIKKIPHAVLQKCEWGRDDYSLNVANLPMAKTDEEIERERMAEEMPLFSGGEND